MPGDGGVADGLSQGECWDSNYKRQEESCWLAHKNLSKQSWEAQASPESRERSVTGDEDFYLQATSAAATVHPPLQGSTDSPSTLHHACDSLFTRMTRGLYALSLALLSPALRCPKGIPTTTLLVPAASQQV